MRSLRAMSRRVLENTVYFAFLELYGNEEQTPVGINPDKVWHSGTIEEVAEILKMGFTQPELDAIMGEKYS